MRAHTITTKSRPKRHTRQCVHALALGALALAIPASASAFSTTSGYDSANVITGGSSGSSQPSGASDYSSVNSIAAPASEPSSESGESTLASGSPANAADGFDFDWGSAAVGAGAAMALFALGGAVLLTVRRRTAISPSTSMR